MPPILWSTDPQTNREGYTVSDSGAILEADGDSLDLCYWDYDKFGTIPLSYADACALRDTLNRVMPK